MRRVHAFMSDWRKGPVVILLAMGLVYAFWRSKVPALEHAAWIIFAIYAIVMLLFGSKWIGGRPEDFR